MNDIFTEIVLVIDRSGSMARTREDAENGLREFIDGQRKVDSPCKISLYRFDDKVECVMSARPLSSVENRDLRIEPRGSTALLDAMSQAINETGIRLNGLPESYRPKKVYFVTVTDGEENASREATYLTVFDKVKHQKEKYSWDFIFIGADQDAIATASKLGIGKDFSISYKNSSIGTRSVYASVTQNIADSRLQGGQQVQCFNQTQRNDAADGDASLLIGTTDPVKLSKIGTPTK